jgi:ABC-type nitrate/sulfonate/bicarbonate transport system substrate-binding protein
MELDYGVPTDKCAVTVRLGIEKGFFREEGIDLTVRVVFGGPPLAAAYDSGQLQMGEIGSPPGVTAISRGACFKVVGSGLRRKAHMYFGARPGLNSWEELKGKRIGMLSRGSCPEWFVRAMLVARGLDPENHLIYVGLLDEYPRIIEVMKEGRIDAGIMVEPNMAMGETQGVINCWGAVYDEPTLPSFQWIIHVARPEFINRQPELLRAVLRACRRSAHYGAEHIDEWIDFGMRQYKVDRPTMERAVKRELPHMHLDGQLDMQGLDEMIRLQGRLGGIGQPITAEEITDLRFMPEIPKIIAAE